MFSEDSDKAAQTKSAFKHIKYILKMPESFNMILSFLVAQAKRVNNIENKKGRGCRERYYSCAEWMTTALLSPVVASPFPSLSFHSTSSDKRYIMSIICSLWLFIWLAFEIPQWCKAASRQVSNAADTGKWPTSIIMIRKTAKRTRLPRDWGEFPFLEGWKDEWWWWCLGEWGIERRITGRFVNGIRFVTFSHKGMEAVVVSTSSRVV